MRIEAQPGPQSDFLACSADIAIYGGAAGGGKTFALLIEPLRHYHNERFAGVIFRRSTVQIRNPGGLWQESENIYHPLIGHPREANLEWTFPSGFQMKFAHLELDRTVYDWQGSQIPYLGFDELTHFTEKQFWYLLSRNRSTSGVSGYVRATCNPDADSWVRRIVDWWIAEDGYPIKERAGVIRWFIRRDNEIIWADTKEELVTTDEKPKSFTFIPSNIRDNKILMDKDPSYLSNLMALSRVERLRLLGGNWNIRPSAGNFFQRGWFEVLDAHNAHAVQTIRYWDRAATRPSEENPDPDWTVGLKFLKLHTGVWVVEHVIRFRDSPLKVEQAVKNIALQDGYNTRIVIEQDPGSSGVADAENYVRLLAGFDVRVRKMTKDKETRARAVSAQSEAGNIKVMRGEWNEAFFNELENFPEGAHDDQLDTLSGAFNETNEDFGILDVL